MKEGLEKVPAVPKAGVFFQQESAVWKILGFIRNYIRHFRNKGLFYKIFSNVFLITVAFVFVYPFLYMITTSIKSYYDLFDYGVNWIPNSIEIKNYTKAFEILEYPRHFLISVVVTASCVFIHVFSDSFIAYGLARYRFPGKMILNVVMILSIMIPIQVIIIPQFLEFTFLKWTNSYFPIIVPIFFGFGLGSGLFIFIFRQFFIGLPKSLEEAAKIDGCSYVRTYFSIVLPTARTSLLVCGVMAMVWHWNDYFAPGIYLRLSDSWPLPSMLPLLYRRYSDVFINPTAGGFVQIDFNNLVTEATLSAGIFMVVLPILVTYIFLQKQFVRGIERSGIVE
ncbi:MAG: carbohydrate ABC transporter permease [Saccharofermentanales bacterium]